MNPQFLHIFDWQKYWLIAVSSMVRARLRASRTWVLPCIVAPVFRGASFQLACVSEASWKLAPRLCRLLYGLGVHEEGPAQIVPVGVPEPRLQNRLPGRQCHPDDRLLLGRRGLGGRR